MPQALDQWLRRLEQRHPSAIDLGLERCGKVWRAMGAPRPGRQVLTVAGTNGKGSTVETALSLLTALGYRSGAYTSPHLLRFNERIRAGGREINDEELVECFERVESARTDISLTYFEFTTLAAFDWLSRQKLDVAVLEVGLGGRLDTVNLVDADCAVITPVGLDHQAFLGDDRESIGREKAGILRAGRPVVVSDRDPPQSVLAAARELNCPIWAIGAEFDRVPATGGSAQTMQLRVGSTVFTLPLPRLSGAHQLDNAAAALAAVCCLVPRLLTPQAGDVEALRRGISNVRMAGRMQKVAGQPTVWVDVGHNPLAAHAIAATLGDRPGGTAGPGVHIVLGMLRDKDAESLALALRNVAAAWYCASLSGDRGQHGEMLARRIAATVGEQPVSGYDSVAGACDAALAAAGSSGEVLVLGSFLTAGEAMFHISDTDRIAQAQGKEENKNGYRA